MARGNFSLEKIQLFSQAYDSGQYATWGEMQKALKINDSGNFRKLRRQAEGVLQRRFENPGPRGDFNRKGNLPFGCMELSYKKDVNFICASDWHCWPSHLAVMSDSYVIFSRFLEEMAKDKSRDFLVIVNGDVFDGTSISRYPPCRWERKPTVEEEVNACKEHLDPIEKAAKKHPNVKLIWTWGNHDERFDSRLSMAAPQFESVYGTSLQHHFPEWTFTQSLLVNQTAYFIHDVHKGKHAAYNNTADFGPNVHVFTGHTHRLLTRPKTFFHGMGKATETGTLCSRTGAQFQYLKGNQPDWQEGFVTGVISGNKVYEELVMVENGEAFWRGDFYEVAV
jgi:hypothetical protein